MKASCLFLLLIQISLGPGVLAAETKVLKDAQTAFDKHDYDQVVALLSPQVERLPKKGLILLGQAYEKADNGIAAVKTYRTALSKNEKDVEVLVYIGLAHAKMGKDDEAIGFMKDAMEINKKYEPAYFALADLYTKKKNRYFLRLLYEDLEKFVSASKKPQVVAQLCSINLQEGFHANAKKKCEEAIRLNPKNPDNYVHLGTAFKETGESKIALRHLHRAADSFKNSELSQFTLGQFYSEQKNSLKAYQYFKRATEADKKSVRSFVALAFVAIEIQKFGEGLAAFEHACTLDRTVEKDLRKATNTVRLVKAEAWLPKFESAIDKCGGGNIFNL